MLDTGEAHGPAATARQEPLARPMPPAPDWDLVTVPSRQGLEAVDILRLRTGVGPVLHDTSGDTLGFLVPAGTAGGWDLPGSACTRTDGRGTRFTDEPPVAGAGWLVPPRGSHPVTDPVLLRMALGEAARTLEAADGL